MIYSNSENDPALTFYPNPNNKKRGKHKIYIGMAPGVGKTYRMLEDAKRLKEEGIDVVIGFLETHGREETIAQSIGLEVVPENHIVWKGSNFREMDRDAVIQRSPQLALIDELAHTNIPGCEHEKRYQDVELVLAAGINVYSTVNIQHLESLNDLVAKITGVRVRERIPDRLLDEADEVVVVDVTAETLEERLRDGKIYAPAKIDQALQNFFQRRNLIALRELALREVADNIEEDAQELPFKHPTCNIRESVLVCVSTNPTSVMLLRRGARLANYMNARFYVLFIADPERFLTKEESLHVETCDRLCQEFGGNFLRFDSTNIVKTITQVAHQYHVTQIVMGATKRSRWELFLKGSLIDKLMRTLKNVDLHIIGENRHDLT